MEILFSDPVYSAYIAALFISIIISVALISYLLPRRSVKAVLPIIGILAAIIFWSLGYLVDSFSTNLNDKLFAYNIQYLGIATIPVIFLLFALQYTRLDRWLNIRNLALLSIIPLITIILVWTKDYHTLMYSNIRLAAEANFFIVITDYGPWFWVFITYSYSLILVSMVMLIHRIFSRPYLYLNQAISIIIMLAAPMIANILFVFRLVPAMPHIDWTASAFSISAICMTYAIFKQRFLDILPVARDYAIEILSDGYLVLNHKGSILDMNRTMENIIGLSVAEAIGKPIPESIARKLKREDDESGKSEVELKVNGEIKYFRVHTSPLNKPALKKEDKVLLFYDITESKQFEYQLAEMATHDYLTGLPNRILFEDRFEMALARAKRKGNKFAILVCDLDEFKTINDTLGHVVADALLKAVARRMNGIMRAGDTLARPGGDEFVILLPDLSTEEEIVIIARRIIDAFHNKYELEAGKIHVSISIGISLYPDHGTALLPLLKKADRAMYYVKNQGGANYRIYRDGD